MAFEKAEEKKLVTVQDEYEASKARLNEKADMHRQAAARVAELLVQLDDARVAEERAREALDVENVRYVELERKVEGMKE